VLVALAGLIAVAAGVLVAFRPSVSPPALESRKYEVGLARARILVDTPASQVVAVSPKGAETLGGRANLLANLMVDGELKAGIAKEAGIPARRLIGVGDPDTGPVAEPGADGRDAYVLRAQAPITPAGGWLPIIDVEAQAPTAAAARTLAAAAVTGVSRHLDTRAAAERVAGAERLRVGGIGVGQARVVTRGPRRLVTLVVALLVFAAGCAGILAGDAVVRSLRGLPRDHPVDGPGDAGRAGGDGDAAHLAVIDSGRVGERAS
jgi:hypothetical protein